MAFFHFFAVIKTIKKLDNKNFRNRLPNMKTIIVKVF